MATGTLRVGGAAFHVSGKAGLIVDIGQHFVWVDTLDNGRLVLACWCIASIV